MGSSQQPRNRISVLLACCTALFSQQFSTAASWTSPQQFPAALSADVGASPQIVGSFDDVWVLVYAGKYQDGTDTEILVSTSTDGAQTWSSPKPLNSNWATDNQTDSQPTLAVSADGIWMCAWRQGNDTLMTARSINNGDTWSAPQPVSPPTTSVYGMGPTLASRGNGRWLLAFDEGTRLLVCRSVDDGRSWEDPVMAGADYDSGYCGNTNYCAQTRVEKPRIYASGVSGLVYVGFMKWFRERAFGTGFTVTEATEGMYSEDGGTSFPNNHIKFPMGPMYRGSQIMATDGRGTWLQAERARRLEPDKPWNLRFSRATEDNTYFSYLPFTSPAGMSVLSANVAMGKSGDAVRLYTVVPETGAGPTATYSADSIDRGVTWSAEVPVETSPPGGALLPDSMQIQTNGRGRYLLVWENASPGGERTIWYSQMKSALTTASGWELYE